MLFALMRCLLVCLLLPLLNFQLSLSYLYFRITFLLRLRVFKQAAH